MTSTHMERKTLCASKSYMGIDGMGCVNMSLTTNLLALITFGAYGRQTG